MPSGRSTDKTCKMRSPLALRTSLLHQGAAHEIGLIPDLIFGLAFPDPAWLWYAPEASANLVDLKKVSSWQQDAFIEKGGWATFPGMSSPERGVAQACANMFAATPKQ